MKKLSQKQKERSIRLIIKRFRKRQYRQWRKIYGKQDLKAKFSAPTPNIIRTDERIIVQAPEHFSFKRNYNNVVGFLNKFRQIAYSRQSAGKRKRRAVTLDLSSIKHLAPGGALVLAAEIDKWVRTRNFRPKVYEYETWDENVRVMLHDLEFFKLFDMDAPADLGQGELFQGATRMIPLMTGVGAPGRECGALQRALMELKGGEIPDTTYMYDGLSEAMTNVSHHAYPPSSENGYNARPEKRWWASGSYNKDQKNLKVMILDLGVGIPRTLPRSRRWEEIRQQIPGAQSLLKDEANLIKVAVQTYRTQTGQENRGRGLVQMSEYVDQNKDGFMKIISRRGEVSHHGRDLYHVRSLQVPFEGTFVEWSVRYA